MTAPWLVPRFIARKYAENVFQGRVDSVALFLDIKGFTAMTEQLMTHGKEGAEVLSGMLDTLFGAISGSIYAGGGFIATFAGDACTALFPSELAVKACNAAQEILANFNKLSPYTTRFGPFRVQARIGLAQGRTRWGIVGGDAGHSFYFRGPAITRAARCQEQAQPMTVVADQAVYRKLSAKAVWEARQDNMFQLTALLDPGSPAQRTDLPADPLQQEHFVRRDILTQNIKGEFRQVVAVFLSFDHCAEHKALQVFMDRMIRLVRTYNGYLESLDFGDKGGHVLVLFGMPYAQETMVRQALHFVQELRANVNEHIRVGITMGTVYAGFKGRSLRSSYGAIGSQINLAARFMTAAPFGGKRNVWLSEGVCKQAKQHFCCEFLLSRSFKGMTEDVPVYVLQQQGAAVTDDRRLPMMGRSSERARITAFLTPIFSAQFPGIHYIYGDAGIGKSRLIEAVCGQLADKATVMFLQCDELLRKGFNPLTYGLLDYFSLRGEARENKPDLFQARFNALQEQLKHALAGAHTDLLKELERTRSMIAALLGVFWQDSLYERLDSKLRYENTMQAIKALFKVVSLLQPLVLVFEDIHVIDEDTQRFVTFFVRALENFPIAILATSRIGDDGAKPGFHIDVPVSTREMVLTELSADSGAEMVTELLSAGHDGTRPGQNLVAFIMEKTQGNPLYVEQFCLYLQENDCLTVTNGILQLARDPGDIPSGIALIIVARIDRLQHELKELVQVASVLGREFDLHVLESLVKTLSSARLQEELHGLLEQGQDQRIWQLLKEMHYMFRHALVQETAYDMQLRERLRRLHRSAGHCLEQLFADRKEFYADLAFHYEKGENREKTMDYLQKAAIVARDRFQNQAALDFLRRYIAKDPPIDMHVTAWLEMEQILKIIGRSSEAFALLQQAIELALRCEDKNIYADCLFGFAQYYHLRNHTQETRKYLSRAREIYQKQDNTEGILAVANIEANILKYEGKYEEALRLYKRNQDLAERRGLTFPRLMAIANQAMVYSAMDRYHKTAELLQTVITQGHTIKDKAFIAKVRADMGIVHYHHGDFEAAYNSLSNALATFKKQGFMQQIGVLNNNLGVLLMDMDRNDEAMRHYHEALAVAKELGDKNGEALALGNMAVVLQRKGRLAESMELNEKKLALCRETGNQRETMAVLANMGVLFYCQGNYRQASAHYEQQLAMAVQLDSLLSKVRAFGRLGNVYIRLKDYAKAKHYLADAIALAQKESLAHDLGEFGCSLAQAHMLTGNFSEAKKWFKQALGFAWQVKHKKTIFYCRLGLVEVRIQDRTSAELLAELNGLESEYVEEAMFLADILRVRYLVTGQEKTRLQAIDMFRQAHRTFPFQEFLERIAELEAMK